jgi:hypothetical protein
LLAGFVYATETEEEVRNVTDVIVGAPGTVNGVMLLLDPLAGPVPCALVAVTVNV